MHRERRYPPSNRSRQRSFCGIIRKRRVFLLLAVLVAYSTVVYYLGSITADPYNDAQYDLSLKLVTSLGRTTPEGPHRTEILGSIALNILSGGFDSIHVVYDHANFWRSHCAEFQVEVQRIVDMLKKSHPRIMSAPGSSVASRLYCHAVNKQPTYYEMLNFCTRKRFRNSVVVLSNADMFFEGDIQDLRKISPDRIGVIATRGFDLDLVSEGLIEAYHLITQHSAATIYAQAMQSAFGDEGFSKQAQTVEDRTGFSLIPSIPNRCYPHPRERLSWDAYVFHASSISISKSSFTSQRGDFYMNELGAENVALSLLLEYSEKIKYAVQLCDFFRLSHIHLEAKTHKANDWIKPVDHLTEAVKFESCTEKQLCLGFVSED